MELCPIFTSSRKMDGKGVKCMDRHEEFLRLFLKHQSDIRAFIGSLIRDRHTREDVCQEVALVLWQEFHRYDRARSFGAWARGIAARKIMQRWEKTSRQ